jgi:putative endonuclease
MSTERRFHVYLLASSNHGTLYLGITSDLPKRIHQHKTHAFPGFSSRYGVDRLVWYQEYDTALEAIECEKKMKKWRRDWKIKLIEEMNPDWSDLYPTLA